jgi:hypothetical protein
MKNILFRLLVAAALTLAAVALSPSAHGQQADEDTTPTNLGPHEGAQQSFAFLGDTDARVQSAVFSFRSNSG